MSFHLAYSASKVIYVSSKTDILSSPTRAALES
jgi:hypothetical protein